MAEKTSAKGKAFALDTPNAKIANLIRKHASADYRARIPEMTQANMAAVGDAINNDVMAWNEFSSSIMNKVGLTIARVSQWNNRLSKFKRGDLAFGDTVEEIHTNLTKAKHYNSNDFHGERDLWGRIKPDSKTAYHKVNREDYYGVTIDRVALRKAFTTENGLALYIDQLMSAPVTSDQWDEYILMRDSLAYLAGYGKSIQIPVIPATGDARTEARTGLKAIIAEAEKMTFPSREYNIAGMDAWANYEDMELLVTPEYKASMDIDALATLFHIDKAEVPGRMTVVDKFPPALGNAQAILTTKDLILAMDYFTDMTNQPNAVGLHTNFFWHHHELISISPFVPFVIFTTDTVAPAPDPEDDPTVTSVTARAVDIVTGETVTTYEPRSTVRIVADVVTDPVREGYAGYAVSEKSGLDARGWITADGILTISEKQTDAIVLDVQSIVDPDVSTTVTLTLEGAPPAEDEGGA